MLRYAYSPRGKITNIKAGAKGITQCSKAHSHKLSRRLRLPEFAQNLLDSGDITGDAPEDYRDQRRATAKTGAVRITPAHCVTPLSA